MSTPQWYHIEDTEELELLTQDSMGLNRLSMAVVQFTIRSGFRPQRIVVDALKRSSPYTAQTVWLKGYDAGNMEVWIRRNYGVWEMRWPMADQFPDSPAVHAGPTSTVVPKTSGNLGRSWKVPQSPATKVSWKDMHICDLTPRHLRSVGKWLLAGCVILDALFGLNPNASAAGASVPWLFTGVILVIATVVIWISEQHTPTAFGRMQPSTTASALKWGFGMIGIGVLLLII